MAELANFSAIVTYFSFAVHCTFTPIGLFFRYLFTITAKIATFLKTKYPTFFGKIGHFWAKTVNFLS